MLAGVTPLLHAALRLNDWAWEPGIVTPLLLAAVLYERGVLALRARDRHHRSPSWENGAFLTGWILLALALLSPLHAASEQLFSAHMIQHELLMAVAAPLIVLGQPMTTTLWAFPMTIRKSLARIATSSSFRSLWRAVSRPFDAWLIHAVVIWGWHIPSLFQATLHNEAIHALQHASFLGSALLFWWAIIHPRRRAALGLSIVYLFTTAVHTAALGALMTFARTPWYPQYANAAAAWGFTAIEDQQLAGLIMWIPASFAYLGAALVIMRRWLRDSELRVAHDERIVAAS